MGPPNDAAFSKIPVVISIKAGNQKIADADHNRGYPPDLIQNKEKYG